LDIGDGDFMVLVGPSGSGKSTALRMVAGLEEVTSGEIRIGDRVVNDLPSRDRDIAMVFQNYALYPNMTVEENLAFGLRVHKTPKDEQRRRVAEAARILNLEPYLKRKPAALSGGQRQRVAMGRAIVREPQAFLMDEPLSSLDAKLRVSTRAELAAVVHLANVDWVLEQLRERKCRFTQSNRRTRDKSGVDDENFAFARSAHDSPARIRLDRVRADRASENEIRIPASNILEGNLSRRLVNVGVDVGGAGNVGAVGIGVVPVGNVMFEHPAPSPWQCGFAP